MKQSTYDKWEWKIRSRLTSKKFGEKCNKKKIGKKCKYIYIYKKIKNKFKSN